VAAITGDGGAGESVVRGRTVTGLTVESGVAANKREPRPLMALDHVGDLPRLSAVAARAIRTELGFVDIRMARLARRTQS
jgi:hypothetical protein